MLSFPSAADATGSVPYGECRAGYWTSNRNLDDEKGINKATCFINWRLSISPSIRFGLAGRLGWADTDAADGQSHRFRELFSEIDSGAWTWRLGRQMIAWGRADRINPTDNLSPRDFTLLVPEDNEQQIGINTLQGKYQFEEGTSLTMVAVPRFEPHKTPKGSMPANLAQAPQPNASEWAVKLDRTGEGFDWAISYFDGLNRFARYWAQPVSPDNVVFRGTFERMRTVGGDFATNVGKWALRGETSASELRPDCEPCSLDVRRIYRFVLGVDRDLAETTNVNFQAFFVRRSIYTDPQSLGTTQRPLVEALDSLNSEFSKMDTGFTFRVSDTYLNERLKMEVGAIINLAGGGLLRPRMVYALSDSLKLLAGLDQFYGKEQSLLGSIKKNQTAYAELAFVF
jgi:hypothetical protein